MASIIPAILSPHWGDIEDKIKEIDGLVPWVHLDVSDGHFAPGTTWSAPDDLELLTGDVKVEVHLMVENPEEIVKDWLTVADRIVIHLESTEKLEDIVDAFSVINTKLVLATLLETPAIDLAPYAGRVDALQLMSIKNIGRQGEIFDDKVLAKIKELRAAAPEAAIHIDGGLNLETGKLCLEAGATDLIVGSALWEGGDVAAIIDNFQRL